MHDRNLAVLHRRQAERYGPRTALRCKQRGLYQDVSWDRYLHDSLSVAAGLVEAGIRPGDRVGMLSENRLEWLLADMAILATGAVNVPAHAPLASNQIAYQFAHAEIRWLFVSTHEQLAKVLPVRRQIPDLQGIVVFDDVACILPPLTKGGIQGGLVAGEEPPCSPPFLRGDGIPWSGFLMRGRLGLEKVKAELDRRASQLTADDLATIMYTSGTTGNPKGVMLTHGNLLSNAQSMAEDTDVDENSILLSWLPYSHIYGRLVDHYMSLTAACTLCLAESQETLIQNLEETQPTSFSAVPRFYEKVLAAVSTSDKQETGRRLRKLFGPRIQWLNSGGAPLPLHIAQAYIDAGLLMLQGYGLTESSPVITFNRRQSNKLGTVGLPVPGVDVRIAEDGEVLTRGPHVMKGYWKNPAATAEAIRDGWLHTGDLGQLDREGFLTITGRKKDLLVLSNGKKVVPTEIEGLLLADDCIDQVVVHGEGKNYLTALIVPRFDKLRAAVKRQAVNEEDQERLVQDPKVYELMERRVKAALVGVSTWEQIRRFILLPRPFTLAADEMTVSLKLRRGVILEKYRRQLERLYSE